MSCMCVLCTDFAYQNVTIDVVHLQRAHVAGCNLHLPLATDQRSQSKLKVDY